MPCSNEIAIRIGAVKVTHKIGACTVLAVHFKKTVIGGSALCATRREPRLAAEVFL